MLPPHHASRIAPTQNTGWIDMLPASAGRYGVRVQKKAGACILASISFSRRRDGDRSQKGRRIRRAAEDKLTHDSIELETVRRGKESDFR